MKCSYTQEGDTIIEMTSWQKEVEIESVSTDWEAIGIYAAIQAGILFILVIFMLLAGSAAAATALVSLGTMASTQIILD